MRGGEIGRRAAVVAALFAAGPVLAEEPKWGAHLDVEAKPGNKRSLGEMGLFVPLRQDGRSLLFGNLIGRFDDHSSREANAGIGFRRMHADGWNLGLYGFFDRRRSNYGNYFNQATLGAEALGRDWDFRANVYHPLGTRVRDLGSSSSGGAVTAALSGSTVQVTTSGATTTTREERALPGFDAEVGWRLPFFNPDDRRQLRVYLGGYRFSDAVSRVEGPRARVEYTAAALPSLWRGAELMLGAEAQDDNVRGGQHFVSLRLRIPFGGKERRSTLTAQERRMTAPVVRDVDIVTGNRSVATSTPATVETATETSGGQAITVLDSATTTGADLPVAVANAGANGLIILSGTFNTQARTTLQSGQTVMGAGTITVRTNSGTTATLSLSSATVSATIAGSLSYPSYPAFLMATNSTLSGLTINNTRSAGGGAAGVTADGISGATISGNSITGTETGGNTGTGLYLLNATNVTVSNNTITGTGSIAIGLFIRNSTVTITGNTLRASGGSSNYHTMISSITPIPIINSGSTGNVKGSGTTCLQNAATGNIYYTDGSTCP